MAQKKCIEAKQVNRHVSKSAGILSILQISKQIKTRNIIKFSAFIFEESLCNALVHVCDKVSEKCHKKAMKF